MRRAPAELEGHAFDVLVVGGGITGACLAFDAATRGMRAGLIDKGDFGAATSAASSKLLHGGLRYLQQLKLGKVRESALERIHFQNLAPHLTRYVPFVVPTYRGLAKGRTLLSAGMLVYEALCVGQNRRLRDRGKRVPSGRGLTAAEVRSMVPGIKAEGLTGGRLFYESHMQSSERMTLAFVDGAARAGATVANYVRADAFLLEGDRVVGVRATDVVGDSGLEIRATVVLNAAGPWIRQLNGRLGHRDVSGIVTGFSKGAHIVTRPLTGDYAVALPTRRPSQSVVDRGGRHIFVIPWRGHALIGTSYEPYEGDLDDVGPTAGEVATLIEDINAALGPGTLSASDVRFAFAGLYPLTERDLDPDVYHGTGDYQIVDHAEIDGVAGLVSVFGARYTTARLLAERALDQVARGLPGDFGSCRTRELATPAGDLPGLDAFRAGRLRVHRERLGEEVVEHLVTAYGTACDEVLALADESPELARRFCPEQPVIAAEAVHAARAEMVCHLDDFVFRRSGLGTLGHPGAEALRLAAKAIASELGWDDWALGRELQRTEARFAS